MSPAVRAAALLSSVLALLPSVGATPPAADDATVASVPAPPVGSQVSPEAIDGAETRRELEELLRLHAPEVGVVIKLDPTLLANESYLSTYPALASFIASHPEVARSPGYYLRSVSLPADEPAPTPGMRLLEHVFEVLGVLSGFVGVTLSLMWLVKTLVQQRRWSRLSRIQTEVHNKLLDRFTSSQEVLAYVQTPAGRRFLESAPIPLEAAAPALAAPLSRILRSLQVGVVLGAAGVGLRLVGGRLTGEVAEAIRGMGVLALCLGGGFVLSGVVAYLLSRKLGLLAPPVAAGND